MASRNNVTKLRIKIPESECTDTHMEYLKRKAPRPWVVLKHSETGRCFLYNPRTRKATYNIDECEPNLNIGLCSIMGGKKNIRKTRKKIRRNRRHY